MGTIGVAERDVDAFCRQGFGALLAKLGDQIPVELSTPVTTIDYSRSGLVGVETPAGTISANTAIVTVSTNVLAASKIKFKWGWWLLVAGPVFALIGALTEKSKYKILDQPPAVNNQVKSGL